uniref:Gelsolin-related protein of 125 kDa-like n=1 Tax=Diabrotica virgifera virgifera TaxID=50390 RepID=A0A6P7GWW5_DIAVI
MDSTKTKKGIVKHEDDYRQGNKDDEKTKKNENGEERPQDGRLVEEEQRRKNKISKKKYWIGTAKKYTVARHRRELGDDVLKEINRAEEEKEEGDTGEEDPSVETVQVEETEAEGEKERQINTQWQDIEESILSALLFDEEDREEMKQNKKRNGDSLEINEKFKKEKREEDSKETKGGTRHPKCQRIHRGRTKDQSEKANR